MTKVSVTMERRPVYERTDAPAAKVTTKMVEILSDTIQRNRRVRVVRWPGVSMARWVGDTITSKHGKWEVLGH